MERSEPTPRRHPLECDLTSAARSIAAQTKHTPESVEKLLVRCAVDPDVIEDPWSPVAEAILADIKPLEKYLKDAANGLRELLGYTDEADIIDGIRQRVFPAGGLGRGRRPTRLGWRVQLIRRFWIDQGREEDLIQIEVGARHPGKQTSYRVANGEFKDLLKACLEALGYEWSETEEAAALKLRP